MTAAVLDALRGRLGAKGVLSDAGDVAPFSTDWRGLFEGRPLCIARPASTVEVAATLRLCAKHGAAVVPQGGNTGLAGGATPDRSGTQVLVLLDRMTAVRRVDPLGLTLEVEAGVPWAAAKAAAADEGRLLPLSLAAEGTATVGGVLATNAGGTEVLRHGMARSLVLGLEVVLADGTVLDRMRRLRKDNAGWDLKQLFVGSEGAYGIVTAAILRLVPAPAHRATALLGVGGVEEALRLLDHAQTTLGEALTGFEILTRDGADLVATHDGPACPVEEGDWLVLVEAQSSLPGLREAAEAMLEVAFEEELAVDGVLAESEAQADGLWDIRERLTEAEAKAGRSVKHDVSVPIDRMPQFVNAAASALGDVAPQATLNLFGHLGDGNLHYNVLLPDGAAGDAAEAINRAVHDAVDAEGGSISAEHGLGQYRVGEWARLAHPAERAVARRVKTALDPHGRLNPGKLLPLDGGEDA